MSISSEHKIPVSPLLNDLNNSGDQPQTSAIEKKRLLKISALSVMTASVVCVIAKVLVYLINLVTNLSFFGVIDGSFRSPAENHLGWLVILLPAIGGLVVGLMALYGSKAIRGHGIPEAMEQILVNQSKIKPSMAFLKPVSSAIAIGTGGPFGAEGPIIATGGALGSTVGQLFKVTSQERKVILTAGATAGMSAIFGTPIAAIFLAIELLLFEFSPRAIVPVALACITGAAGHHLLFETEPVFMMANIELPSNKAVAVYSFIGLIIGFLSLGITRILYFIEDSFEKLPIHWMWWPAIGGIAVGFIGYFYPDTLGVGYSNITNMLSGKVPLILMISLCVFKFLSWAIALGSGTSGGTLAPLLTIGGASGAIIGSLITTYFPEAEINIPLSALVGMSAMFAGASRAYLTSIAFALETTMQSNALLPLLGACTSSYIVSFFLMENTIMTEKIARRGVYTPDSYEPDPLRKNTAGQFMQSDVEVLAAESSVAEIRTRLLHENTSTPYFILVSNTGFFEGLLEKDQILQSDYKQNETLLGLLSPSIPFLKSTDTLSRAVELMGESGKFVLPVMSSTEENIVVGVLAYKDLLSVYKVYHKESKESGIHLSINPEKIRMLMSNFRKISSRNV